MLDRDKELKDRIIAKQKALESKYHELKAETRNEARTERDKIKERLDELQESVKDGWDKMTDKVKAKLNDWLSRD